MAFGLGQDMGLDLGTATILVYVAGRGIVVREPSMLAIDRGTGEVIVIGERPARCWAAPRETLWPCAL